MTIRKYLPNLLTLLNMSLGTLAILFVIQGYNIDNFFIASILILCAALLDRYDGKLARYFQAESEFGKQLDSFSDLISFGLAPILITWHICLFHFKYLGILAVIIYLLCGTLRLARFNTTNNQSYYTGLPITLAGCLVVIINLILCHTIKNDIFFISYPYFILIFTLIISFLMVASFKIKKI